MFEQEIQTAKDRLSDLLHGGSPFVYLRDIVDNPAIHDFYKVFFAAESDWWIFEQQMLRESNPRFDYSLSDFQVSIQDFDKLCRASARFDVHDLEATIDLAVKTRINYLLRPRTTLKWFVYRGEPTKPLQEIGLRLAYLREYRYLIDGFQEWVRKRRNGQLQLNLLSVVEFERAIESIDNDEILDYSPTQFTDLLQPVFEFFRDVYDHQAVEGIPTPAMIVFLDDKGVFRISQELERLLKEEHQHYITQDRLLRVIDEIIHQVEMETTQADYSPDQGGEELENFIANRADDSNQEYVVAASYPGAGEPADQNVADAEQSLPAADDSEHTGDDLADSAQEDIEYVAITPSIDPAEIADSEPSPENELPADSVSTIDSDAAKDSTAVPSSPEDMAPIVQDSQSDASAREEVGEATVADSAVASEPAERDPEDFPEGDDDISDAGDEADDETIVFETADELALADDYNDSTVFFNTASRMPNETEDVPGGGQDPKPLLFVEEGAAELIQWAYAEDVATEADPPDDEDVELGEESEEGQTADTLPAGKAEKGQARTTDDLESEPALAEAPALGSDLAEIPPVRTSTAAADMTMESTEDPAESDLSESSDAIIAEHKADAEGPAAREESAARSQNSDAPSGRSEDADPIGETLQTSAEAEAPATADSESDPESEGQTETNAAVESETPSDQRIDAVVETETATASEPARRPKADETDVDADQQNGMGASETAESNDVVEDQSASLAVSDAESVRDTDEAQDENDPAVKEAEQQHQATGASESVGLVEQPVIDSPDQSPALAETPSPEADLPALEEIIDADNRDKIVKKVFNKNEAQYLQALQTLQTADSWKHALALMDKILAEQGTNPHSSQAETFRDLVLRRYES